jgi:predicted lipoprotein with Yx(FWY)xxD motif
MSKNMKMAIGALAVIIIAIILFAVFNNKGTDNQQKSNQSANAGQKTAAGTNQSDIVLTKTDPSLGQYLTDPAGRALYTYSSDSNGTSNCTGSCLATWPAYTATSSSANLPSGITTFTRSDNGRLQYAYNGMPLYYFVSDSGTKVTGDGVEGFSVAKPAAATNNNSSTQDNSSDNSSGYPY